MLLNLIKLIRAEQWVKNGFIFFALFFGKRITHLPSLYNDLVAFVGFCLVASSVYCINDVLDVSADRQHPQKRYRPVASGIVSIRQALFMSLLLLISGFSVFLLGGLTYHLCAIVFLYYLMSISYCFYFKHIPIIDVFILSIGFVIRVIVGGVAADITLSHWIIIMTFLLALFLAFAKRRDDLIIYNETGVKIRRGIDRYNINFMNAVLTVTSTIIVVSYIMYTVSVEVTTRYHTDKLYYTSIFVIGGVFRYLQLTMVDSDSRNPTGVFYKDRFIQAFILCWILALTFIIYYGH